MRVLLAVLVVGIAGCGGQETLTLKGHSWWVTSVSFSSDGKRLVSGSADKTVKIRDVWSLDTSK